VRFPLARCFAVLEGILQLFFSYRSEAVLALVGAAAAAAPPVIVVMGDKPADDEVAMTLVSPGVAQSGSPYGGMVQGAACGGKVGCGCHSVRLKRSFKS
jgi:hypothetical protein